MYFALYISYSEHALLIVPNVASFEIIAQNWRQDGNVSTAAWFTTDFLSVANRQFEGWTSWKCDCSSLACLNIGVCLFWVTAVYTCHKAPALENSLSLLWAALEWMNIVVAVLSQYHKTCMVKRKQKADLSIRRWWRGEDRRSACLILCGHHLMGLH